MNNQTDANGIADDGKAVGRRFHLLQTLTALSVASLVASNIITNKQTDILGFAITCGSFTIPIDYIVSDVLAEVYGYREARRATIIAFLCDLLCVAFFTLTLAAPQFATFTAQDAFQTVLGSTPRILAASFTAYVVGSLSNAKVMELMHVRDGEDRLALRCIASTVVGETLDMTVFSLMAFAGVLPWDVIFQMIVVASVVKVAVECVCYPLVTRRVIGWAKGL